MLKNNAQLSVLNAQLSVLQTLKKKNQEEEEASRCGWATIMAQFNTSTPE